MNIYDKINQIKRNNFIKIIKQATNVRMDLARKQGLPITLEDIIGDDMYSPQGVAMRKQFNISDDEFKQIIQETIDKYKNAGAVVNMAGVLSGDKIGRNSPCPCGSGKKYKKCCGG